MGTAQWGLVGGVITAMFTMAGMVWVAKINNKTAKVNASTPPYDSLAARVSTLEESDQRKSDRIDALEEQLRIVTRDRDGMVRYFKEMWRWASSGSGPKRPPPPIPDHLHSVLPPSEYVWHGPPQERT